MAGGAQAMTETATADRLNLGCGTDIRAGHVNLDVVALPGVDVVHDLADLPLPFPDGRFAEIVCKDVLEHVDYVPVLRELHRILRPGGLLHVEAPHFTSRAVYLDPTHRTAFTIDTLRFFVPTDSYFAIRSYYFDFGFDRVVSARIVFHRYRWQPWNYVLEALVNQRPQAQRAYESTGLSRLFPAANVRVTLAR
jgi:SAM-dependent methyltransferase